MTASQHGTFSAAEAVELAVVTRDGFVESRHIGSAVVLDTEGTVVGRYGNPDAPVYPRSALKPYIAVAVMASGITLRGEDAAIATASHSGTPLHVARVRDLLSRAGLTERSLACPATLPSDAESREQLLRSGGSAAPIFMGCSGKHAAVLLACVHNDWPLDTYLEADHPMWSKVREVTERLTGERPSAPTIDGCGTPLFAVSLSALARGLQRMALSSESSPFALHREAGALASAMRDNGELICGPGEPETIAIERLGVVSKLGFEGVQTMVAPNGVAVALKTLDGSLRPGVPVAIELLARHGGIDRSAADAVLIEVSPRMWGGPREIGALIPTLGD